MITLKTGAIGSGKTLSAVSEVAKLQERWQKREGEWREVFAFGVRDLALPHRALPAYPAGGKPGDAVEFDDLGQPKTDVIPQWEAVPPGAIVIIDECHRLFPTSGPGKPAPHVAWLDMSRQAGIDIVLITQHPRKLHVYARTAVNKHQHYRRALGRKASIVYEWDECSIALNYRSASTRLFRYPADSFKFYTSAEEHTNLSFALPMWTVVPVAGIILGILAGPRAWAALHSTVAGKGLSEVHSGASQQAVSASAPAAAPVSVASSSQPLHIVGCIDAKPKGFCVDSQGNRVEMPPDVVAWNARNIGGFVRYDLGQAGGMPRPALPVPVSAGSSQPDAPQSALSFGGIQHGHPVRSGATQLGVLGGAPSFPAADHDGDVIAGMHASRAL